MASVDAASAFFWAHPLWVWLAVGAAFLAVEAATGSGWMLWPAAAAGAVGVASLFVPMTFAAQLIAFAALTIVSTYIGRRWLRGSIRGAQDINDPHSRLIGQSGVAASGFAAGRGRAFVDGKEWSAELEGETPVAAGDKVEVVAVLGGARLKVRLG
jgi:membrane protein implicated in regulation of membrane protease activity